MVFNKSQCWIKNIVHNTVPVMIHGQGIGRVCYLPVSWGYNSYSQAVHLQRKLLTLSNYVPDRWSPNTGCKHCDDHVFSLQGKPVSSLEVYCTINIVWMFLLSLCRSMNFLKC